MEKQPKKPPNSNFIFFSQLTEIYLASTSLRRLKTWYNDMTHKDRQSKTKVIFLHICKCKDSISTRFLLLTLKQLPVLRV